MYAESKVKWSQIPYLLSTNQIRVTLMYLILLIALQHHLRPI